MNTPKTALATALPLVDVPCRLYYQGSEVTSHVILDRLDPNASSFAVTPCTDPEDTFVSFTFSNDKLTIYLRDPMELVLESRTELEVNLPRIEIIAVHPTHQKHMFTLGVDRILIPPTTVTRSTSDEDLNIGVNFDGSSTPASPTTGSTYCQLSWLVNSSPCSLRFATAAATAATSHPPLIVTPKRLDW